MKTQKPITIHFVCRGNTFRSRLAAAYFAELSGTRFAVTSSGVGAELSEVKTLESYTKAVAHRHKLKHGLVQHNTQTTDRLLQEADVVVFLNKDIYDQALKDYQVDSRKVLVWHVKDIDPEYKRQRRAAGDEAALEAFAEQTFDTIAKHCRELQYYLTHTAWVDIVTKDNQLTGLRLPMAWATDRGLWHRGIHVVARTSDGKYVVGKRSSTIVFAPNLLEITLGGGVDSGEHPLEAAVRETHEELGVQVSPSHFRPLFRHVEHAYHPHYKKYTRCHLYVYAVTLPHHSQRLTPQPGEVAELRVLSVRQLNQLLTRHRMKNFGRLNTKYKLYKKAVTAGATL
jgi:isopentenyl-diphosphate delta-isomerase